MCKIAIVESSPLFSSGLARILNEFEGFIVVSESENADKMEQDLGDTIPDVIVFNAINHFNGGIKSVKKIRRHFPGTNLLLIVSDEYGFYFQEYIRLGVKGLILKTAKSDQLIKAINKLNNGEDYFKSDIWNVLKNNLRSGKSGSLSTGINPKLSEREADVAKLFCEGLSYKEIGVRLHISPRTVESHKNNILAKLNLNSLADLIKYTLANSL